HLTWKESRSFASTLTHWRTSSPTSRTWAPSAVPTLRPLWRVFAPESTPLRRLRAGLRPSVEFSSYGSTLRTEPLTGLPTFTRPTAPRHSRAGVHRRRARTTWHRVRARVLGRRRRCPPRAPDPRAVWVHPGSGGDAGGAGQNRDRRRGRCPRCRPGRICLLQQARAAAGRLAGTACS